MNRADPLGHHLAVVALVLVVAHLRQPLEAKVLGQGLAVVGREDGVGDLGLGHAPLAGYLARQLEAVAHEVAGDAVAAVARGDADVEDLEGQADVVELVQVDAALDLPTGPFYGGKKEREKFEI